MRFLNEDPWERLRTLRKETRAAMGTAETPAEPMRGLIFSFTKRFMNLARSTPPAVPKPKATTPMNIGSAIAAGVLMALFG